MIKAVLIDIDNTLLDFEAYVEQSLKDGMAKFSIAEYEPYMLDVFHTENNKLWKRIEEGTITLEELRRIRFNNVFSALGFDFDGTIFETYFRQCLNESAILVEGAEELLDYLSKNYIVCSASNGPYKQQIHRLEVAGLSKYFTHHFISENIGFSKPSKEYFDGCLSILKDIEPSQCVMIGDSESADITGGKNAGMKTIFFDKKKKNPDTKADKKVQSLVSIQMIINEL